MEGLFWLFILFLLVNFFSWLKKVLTGGAVNIPQNERYKQKPTRPENIPPYEAIPDLEWVEEEIFLGHPEEAMISDAVAPLDSLPLPAEKPQSALGAEEPRFSSPIKPVKSVRPSLRPVEIVSGVIWSEILQPPRCRRPYQWGRR
ncbi:MAG: hypothetical protein GX295_02725 [Syntrophomonadaceae bacterium]|nr:hypothetical protein [Syntrophomonadaceae bacterium]